MSRFYVVNTLLVQMLFVACEMNQLIQNVAARWRERTVTIRESARRSGRYCTAGLPDPDPQFVLQLYALDVSVWESTIMVSSQARQETSLQNHSPNDYIHVCFEVLTAVVMNKPNHALSLRFLTRIILRR
jgi:hypothetical protein